jgi:hypothetical protein
MKFTTTIFLLCSLLLAGQEREKEIQPAPNDIIKQGKDFREELTNKDITASNRVCIALKYLSIAESYLINNRPPSQDPQRNVAPPNGGRAGVDPSTIHNPEDRRKYEEAIAANIVLIETHNAWREASKMKNDAISLISGELQHDSNILLEDASQQLWKQLPETVRQEIEAKRFNK